MLPEQENLQVDMIRGCKNVAVFIQFEKENPKPFYWQLKFWDWKPGVFSWKIDLE
jgi:hypothetical protein